MDFHKMLEQAQKMQLNLQEVQEKLKDIEVESDASSSLVKVRMSCSGKVLSVQIDDSLMESDKNTLENLITAAMNSANDAKEERIKSETKKTMEGIDLPKNIDD